MRRLGDEKRYGTSKRRRKLRRALLSVYYHTVGREFEVRGAPSVLLPPEVAPLSLQDALAVIAKSPGSRLEEALWRIVQNATMPDDINKRPAYPGALRLYFDSNEIDRLDALRRNYRIDSAPFALTVMAARDERSVHALESGTKSSTTPETDKSSLSLARSVSKPLAPIGPTVADSGIDDRAEMPANGEATTGVNFDAALVKLLKYAAGHQYIDEMVGPLGGDSQAEARLQKQLTTMRSELGMGATDIVANLADIAAFEDVNNRRKGRIAKAAEQTTSQAQSEQETRSSDERKTVVYPVRSVVKQDTTSLAISATATSIVHGEWQNLIDAIHPAHWQCSSDIIKKARFVTDALTLDTFPDGAGPKLEAVGTDDAEYLCGLLEEDVVISWDDSELQQAQYHNVLNVEFSTRKSKGEADVYYDLCRSINSSILWDRGPGGLLSDQGYIKLRRLGLEKDVWRATMHKEVVFGDQAGSGTGSGIRDLSRIISQLAPVAITYWLEWEIYSLGDPHIHDSPPPSLDEKLDQLLGVAQAMASSLKNPCQ